MTKIGLIILTVLTSSCTKLFDIGEYSEMTVNIKNNSDLTIKKAGFYAHNSGSNLQTFADSVFVENILTSNSKQFIAKESNKLGGDGDFQLILIFENGVVKKTGCCYYTNGQFQNSTIDFEVKKDTILQKATFEKY
ncbi:hypothetical protein EGI26_06435 [Lacihabitans sp. CCS-44]|uniref:hypothetical protein n=1 Tax=Lacihabitans sp. CCS-44 TaxID=2487331 RepID=UPI0020CE1509|nr:hypothetical protein [Lacihabitans sp. CCS-44]MCP9754798.1 hypothetical protein [Lacihabitans sp. CCS-44]